MKTKHYCIYCTSETNSKVIGQFQHDSHIPLIGSLKNHLIYKHSRF